MVNFMDQSDESFVTRQIIDNNGTYDNGFIIKANDPNGWIHNVAHELVYCPEDFCTFYHIIENSVERMKHTKIQRDDCVQVKIKFAPYAFVQKKSGIAGIRVLME